MVKRKKAKRKATRKTTKKKAKKKVTKKKAKKRTTKKKVKKKVTRKKVTRAKGETRSGLDLQAVNKVASLVKKPRTKGEIMRIMADCTGLSKKEIDGVFATLADLINMDIGKRGPGVFSLPGLLKIVRVSKPATRARKGINPFTGEEMMFKAKPARNAVKVRPLKSLKEMVK